MPSRIQVIEKVNNSIDSSSSSSINDRYDGDETTLQNTSIALLPSTNKEKLRSRDSNFMLDPDETRLDNSLNSEKIFDPDETSLDIQDSSQRHLIIDQTLHLTLTPIENRQVARSPSPSKLILQFPKMTLESRNDDNDIQEKYKNKYQGVIKKILDDNRNVDIPSFSSSTDIDERLTYLYEIIQSNENIHKIISMVGEDKSFLSRKGNKKDFSERRGENVLPSGKKNILSSREEEAPKVSIHASTPDFSNIHESQEHSFNLSTANVHFDSNVKGAREVPSIEITRADIECNLEMIHSFQSPIASTGERQGMKRLASVSGKRGMDRKKGAVHEHTPEDEKLIDDSYGGSDPFEAYNKFSQHVNNIMMDSPSFNERESSPHSNDDKSNDDPSSFMKSALESQSSHVSNTSQNYESSIGSLSSRKHGSTAISIKTGNMNTCQDQDLHHSFEYHEIMNDVNTFESPNSNESVSSVHSKVSLASPHTMNSNTDSIITEEGDIERNISLQSHSRLCYNPLDVYRPPKWAKSYDKRNLEKNKHLVARALQRLWQS